MELEFAWQIDFYAPRHKNVGTRLSSGIKRLTFTAKLFMVYRQRKAHTPSAISMSEFIYAKHARYYE